MQRPISVDGITRNLPWGRRTRKQRPAIHWREALTAYAFLSPYLIIMTVFILITALTAFGYSFFYVDFGFTQPVFAGLHNYRVIWYDFTHQGAFLISIINIFKYTIGVVTLQTIVALALALLINQRVRGIGFFRTAFYLPSLTSSVAISIIFLWLYNQQGAINYLLSLVGIPAHAWLNDPTTALPSIMLLVIWTSAPSMMLIYLAGLQDIPETLYEAARIDGANTWQLIRYITVPLLRPTTFLVVALGTIGAFQAFDQVYVMQGPSGGPLLSTITPVLEIYNTAFQNSLMGLACAEAFILFIVVFAFTYLERRFIDTDVQF
ncbi:MAG TPA: sugar ABC transporter permease [Ktedonobacterales bacterium]|jgi:multiple sugar transport system permease protein|nr:sugar ABC transporter permease [Ktedonobacterales bacterium]